MIAAIDLNQKEVFEVEGTKFHLKRMKKKEMMELAQRESEAKGNLIAQFICMGDALKKGLQSVEGISINGESKNIDVINDDIIELLPNYVMTKVYLKIVEINTPKEPELKN